MDKIIMPNEEPEQRVEYLQSTADMVVEETYYHRLSKEELTAKKAEFTANALEVDDLEEQKKEMLKTFKDQLDPLKDIHKTLGNEIRTGFVARHGILYAYIDHGTRMVYYYSETGELIETKTRPATSDELSQLKITHSRRTGTI